MEPPAIHFGPPGTSETHAVVEIQRADDVQGDVWRIRSQVKVDGVAKEAMLPESKPSKPLSFPTDYVIVARDRSGEMSVVVEALGANEQVLGRARGTVKLKDRERVYLKITLTHPCVNNSDCEDGKFCNGEAYCDNGLCVHPGDPCATSVNCAKSACLEDENRCNNSLDHSACHPITHPDGTEEPQFCDEQKGCVPGVPDAPVFVGSPEVSPAIGTIGTVFHVRFDLNERLKEDPIVRINIGTTTRPCTLVEAGTNRTTPRYEFIYTALGDEPQGERDITVYAVDQTENAGNLQFPHRILLDFIPPTVVGSPILTNQMLRANAVAQLDISFSEDLDGPPVVRMAQGDNRPAANAPTWTYGGVTERTHRFTHQATGTLEEGVWKLWVECKDAAGNTCREPDGEMKRVGEVVMDYTPPSVTETTVIPLSRLASKGRTVTVQVTFSEKLPGTPVLTAVPAGWEGDSKQFIAGERDARTLTYFHEVAGPEEDGTYDLMLTGLTDTAGNTHPPINLGPITFDSTPPDLKYFNLSDVELNAKEVIEATFEVNEELGPDPSVRLAGFPLNRIGSTTMPYKYTLDLAGTNLVGTYSLSLVLEDRVGNKKATEAGNAVIDAVPPFFVDAVFTPAVARLNITAYLSITVSEQLQEPPTITWAEATGDPGFTYVAKSGLTYSYGLYITNLLHPGVYRLDVLTFTDKGGNEVRAKVDEDLGLILDFTVDNQAPVITNVRTDRQRYSAIPGYNVVELTFDSTEATDEPPAQLDVRLGEKPMGCGSKQPTFPSYTCRLELKGDELVGTNNEQEGTALIAIFAKDMAGNVGVGNAAVQLDFAEPYFITNEVRPDLAHLGETINFAFFVNEPLLAVQAPAVNPEVVVTGPGAVTLEYVTGSEYIYRYTTKGGDKNGNYSIAVTLTDSVGNTVTLPGGDFDLDVTPPMITNIATTLPRYSDKVPFNVVTLTMDLSENVDGQLAELRASVGPYDMQCDPYSSEAPNYTCRYTTTGNEPQGKHPISIEARDSSGNLGYGRTSVLLDFAPPEINQGTVSLQLTPGASNPLDQVSRIGVGTTATLSFAVTEPLHATIKPSVATRTPQVFTFTTGEPDDLANTFTFTLTQANAQQGLYSLVATLTDSVGNVGDVTVHLPPAGLQFAIDTVAPTLVTESGPPAYSSLPAADFKYHSTEEDLFLCRFDNGQQFDCAAQERVAALQEGPHSFKVSAVDAAGNVGQEYTWQWTVDQTPPTVIFTSTPPPTTPEHVANFAFDCNDPPCTFECRLDNGDYGPCSSPSQVSGLAVANHTYLVRATDRAGNTGPSATAPWRVLGDWLMVANGARHSCAIAEGNTLWCWGENTNGQLGDTTEITRSSPVQVGTETDWASVTSSNIHTCAMKLDNSIWCWGANSSNQLGTIGTFRTVPTRVGVDNDWLSISAGGMHTCALRQNHTVWCWGDCYKGQVGPSCSVQIATPTKVDLATDWKQLAAGFMHTCAVKTDGTMWCWGWNDQGQLGDNTLFDQDTPTRVGDGTNWDSVQPGYKHTCARTLSGTLWCWGYNYDGQLGDGSRISNRLPLKVGDQSGWRTVTASMAHTCAIDAQQRAWCWGAGEYGRLGDGSALMQTAPAQVGTFADWTSLSTGNAHTCGTRANGTLWCWGINAAGQLGLGLGANKLVPVQIGTTQWNTLSAGSTHNCAIQPNKSLWCWGNNSFGQLGDNSVANRAVPIAVAPGESWSAVGGGTEFTCGIKEAGNTLWCWGNPANDRLGLGSPTPTLPVVIPTLVATPTGFASVSGGASHGCGVLTNGDLYCWGRNSDGQLGDGSTTGRSSPVQVLPAGVWSKVTTGSYFSCAIRTDGSLWCWGSNAAGQAGINSTTSPQRNPQPVAAGQKWLAVDSGANHSCAIREDQTLWCWGLNDNYQLGDESTTNRLVPTDVGMGFTWKSVGLGSNHTCAVTTGNQLWCWGKNDAGQVGNDNTFVRTTPAWIARTTQWDSVTGGSSHTCAKAMDQTVWCWGSNQNGQSGDGSAWRERPVEVGRQ